MDKENAGFEIANEALKQEATEIYMEHARQVRVYYRSMVDAGFDEHQSFILTQGYQIRLVNKRL